ncbi:hypothetical protein FOL47_008546 [Perkinsus chesapeaki]|uniref:Uncharacterized protein n=1 Tax=Perkinsus chesapeaki TaxID=330153 RepID=A0A7J6LDA5_PERCH|nr:hypothetical protein FOL47_008546 [Perkinsus chesapeaki]
MRQLFPFCFVVNSLGVAGEPLDTNKFKTLLQPSLRETKSFTYPVGCLPARRRFLEQYCVVGTYTTSDTVNISLDLHIYDANDNTKTVLIGMSASFKDGNPTAMSSRASGCADLVDQTLSYGSLRAIVNACMSDGGPGKYNPATKEFTAPVIISSNVVVRGFGRDLINDRYNLTGHYHAGNEFDMGMNATIGTQRKRDGIYDGTLGFDVSFGTVANNLFAWHTFSGVRSSAQLLDFRPAFASYPFLDLILNVKP